jgi:hypothetical protein
MNNATPTMTSNISEHKSATKLSSGPLPCRTRQAPSKFQPICRGCELMN